MFHFSGGQAGREKSRESSCLKMRSPLITARAQIQPWYNTAARAVDNGRRGRAAPRARALQTRPRRHRKAIRSFRKFAKTPLTVTSGTRARRSHIPCAQAAREGKSPSDIRYSNGAREREGEKLEGKSRRYRAVQSRVNAGIF